MVCLNFVKKYSSLAFAICSLGLLTPVAEAVSEVKNSDALKQEVDSSKFDTFSNDVKAVWLDDGRRMKLLEEISYTDPRGKIWFAEAGATTDGASIPPALWSYVGTPYIGQYRKASVIHDYYCEKQIGNSDEVHLMFYEASLNSGMEKDDALRMYAALKLYGCSWEDKIINGKQVRVNTTRKATLAEVIKDLDRISPIVLFRDIDTPEEVDKIVN